MKKFIVGALAAITLFLASPTVDKAEAYWEKQWTYDYVWQYNPLTNQYAYEWVYRWQWVWIDEDVYRR